MSGTTARLTLTARMARWDEALAFVEAFCARHGVARDDALRLILIAEELFTNIVRHGHAGGADDPVLLELDVAPGHLLLTLEDRAAPFDPIAHARAQPPDLEAEAADRPVGGLGLHLALELAAEAHYAHEQGCNRIRVVLAAPAGTAAAIDQGAVLPR